MALADWHEESGEDSLAAGYRWLARTRRIPSIEYDPKTSLHSGWYWRTTTKLVLSDEPDLLDWLSYGIPHDVVGHAKPETVKFRCESAAYEWAAMQYADNVFTSQASAAAAATA